MTDLRSKIKRWVALPNGRAGRDAPTGARRKRFRRNLPRRFRAGLSLSRKGPRRPRLCASADPDLRRRSSGTARSMLPNRSWEMRVSVDAQADMLSAEASSAMCVQKFDDSRTVCRSHYVSHLAAFFIVARAKISPRPPRARPSPASRAWTALSQLPGPGPRPSRRRAPCRGARRGRTCCPSAAPSRAT